MATTRKAASATAAPAAKTAATKAPAKAAPKKVKTDVSATAPAARKTTAKPAASRKPRTVPAEQRRHYVEVAAFYIAERRGFTPGNTLDDWVAAEAEIDRLLADGRLG